jgi:catechol 2,3-dioxygenase-like lactoylglutathione lyase family enzyme
MPTNRSPKISGIFETHLTVRNLDRSIAFYRDRLGLTLARHYAERNVAFFWAGQKADGMLGLWETGQDRFTWACILPFASILTPSVAPQHGSDSRG